MTESSLPWTQPDWLSSAQAWIEQAVHVTGPVEQPHIRPWATVLRVPTADGVCFFKAGAPQHSFEPALTLALAARGPDCLPEIVAADPARGWLLTRDAGTPLRAILHAPEDLRLLDSILPQLAQLQMQWLGRSAELVALGVFDRRIETLAGQFENLAADPEALMLGLPRGLSAAQHEQLLAAVPRYTEMCAQLAQFPIPNSIHYDDMHTGNIFLRGTESGPVRVTFSDWGDSAASHPFCSLLIFTRAISDAINLPDEATETPENLPPVLTRLRDVYLEPWQAYDTRANLVEAFNLAWRVGMGARALTWNSILQALDEADRPDYRYTVPAWLGEFLLSL